MFYIDIQNELPVSYCECCHGEIFSADFIYDLAEIYMSGRCLVHEDCLIESIEQNKALVMEYLFSDWCLLKDIFDSILMKRYAFEIVDDWGECDDDE